jgi:hypothetical protein
MMHDGIVGVTRHEDDADLRLSQHPAVQRHDDGAPSRREAFGFRPEPRNGRRGDSALSLDVRVGAIRLFEFALSDCSAGGPRETP